MGWGKVWGGIGRLQKKGRHLLSGYPVGDRRVGWGRGAEPWVGLRPHPPSPPPWVGGHRSGGQTMGRG
jgi:hypothetical protein